MKWVSHNFLNNGPCGPRSDSKPICPITSRVLAVIVAKTTPGCSLARSKILSRFLLFCSCAEAELETLDVVLDRLDSEDEWRLRRPRSFLVAFRPFFSVLLLGSLIGQEMLPLSIRPSDLS